MNELIKTCSCCKKEKSCWEFSSNAKYRRSSCKACRSSQQNDLQKANPEKTAIDRKRHYEDNKARIQNVHKLYRTEHREEINSHKKEYYSRNKDLWKSWNEQHKSARNQQLRNRRLNDPAFRVSNSLRARLNSLVKSKTKKSQDYVGISGDQLEQWLRFQFASNMSWENYPEEWVIDHVVPVAEFDLTDETKSLMCFNWTNLRPLNKTANGIKASNIILSEILRHISTVKQFLNTHTEYQTALEKVWWLGEDPGSGNNLEDKDEDYIIRLQSAIRSQISKSRSGYETGSTTK